MTDYVLVPGMNHGGWWYDPLVEALEDRGHRATAITPAGLENEPVLNRRIVLDTHIDQVVAAVDAASSGVVLVGHSYAGLLITAAADARPEAVGCLVYLDAFLPEDGDNAWSLANDEQRDWYAGAATRGGDVVDPLPFFDDRARPHPLGTLFQSVRLTGAWRRVPRAIYVEATEWPTPTPMRTSIDRAVTDPHIEHLAWRTRHNVMHDGPDRVLGLIADL
ncbi:alpha/beta fold hydrolase [Tsukamurella sp. 8F]|uniref:alpha/beta fold hydrolase n=1 Tax=unclassified Tsukamurella TaxID=2633480 RepID=UPI0023B9455A|nr:MULTISPECIES: alpha/beta fold hydrolase [unclassified Tsukamurella]MDF0530405.1 alpha/beta fold hydrolase [Tsukamurella sp. 8J]MDF0587774.1 alpha/beta fold hydrolase [Tsukamurella sp. 8F]